MSEEDVEQQPMRITADEIAQVKLPQHEMRSLQTTSEGSSPYGRVFDASDEAPESAEERGSILLKGWFYLGVAGTLGALMGWAICEPFFVDGVPGLHLGDMLMLPTVVAFMTLGLGIAESLVERSWQKALLRSALSLPLGMVLGLFISLFANLFFGVLLLTVARMGVHGNGSPLFWVVRSLAWMVFGVAGGIVYGIVGQSYKKGKFGVLGGVIGAAVGGLIFDPINLMVHTTGASISRAVGFAIFGAATGVLMGVVESALKDRWLYVIAGPLAGKQFILYKPVTVIGSMQSADLYLFKDAEILPQHARITQHGTRFLLESAGPVRVRGMEVKSRVLLDGDVIEVGRYSFRYKEKNRA